MHKSPAHPLPDSPGRKPASAVIEKRRAPASGWSENQF